MEVDPPAQPTAAPPAAGTDAEPPKTEAPAPAPAMDNPQVCNTLLQAHLRRVSSVCLTSLRLRHAAILVALVSHEVGHFAAQPGISVATPRRLPSPAAFLHHSSLTRADLAPCQQHTRYKVAPHRRQRRRQRRQQQACKRRWTHAPSLCGNTWRRPWCR